MLNYTEKPQNTYIQSWTSMTSRKAYSTSTPQKPTHFDVHYLRNRSTLDIGVLGYIGIV